MLKGLTEILEHRQVFSTEAVRLVLQDKLLDMYCCLANRVSDIPAAKKFRKKVIFISLPSILEL